MTAFGYRDGSVLDAARERIADVFDHFERVVVSVSGGKDSTVVRHLALEEARRRGRRIELFFLDQEAEYASTVAIIESWMAAPDTDPAWMQVPLRLTNATSHRSYFFNAWGEGEAWLRPKHPLARHAIEEDYPTRFYDFFAWYESLATTSTAFLIGLRTRESFNRFRAVSKAPAYRDWAWTTKTASPLAYRAYPIFDWTTGDVWRAIATEGLTYNRHYDRLFALHGANERNMRVSNLVHEQAFRSLVDLQEIEPDTYERLVARLHGVHAAALYAREGSVFDAKELPAAFPSWRAFRDHLLDTTPIDQIARFRARFARQRATEETCRQQVKQILTNDWENNVPVAAPRRDKLREVWWNRL